MHTTHSSRIIPALIVATLAVAVIGASWYIAAGHEASASGSHAGVQLREGGGAGNGGGEGGGNGPGNDDWAAELPSVDPAAELSPAELADLRFMAEEEKLARDLYTAFAAVYQRRAWDNIAASESRHLDEVRLLLDRYGVADPTAGAAAGSFESGELQAMYDDLLAQGLASEAGALAAGKLVEIDDLARLAAAAAVADDAVLDAVYANLGAGSERHLATFERLAG
jgi:hypothetical protein